MPMYFKADMKLMVLPQIAETMPGCKYWVLSDDGQYEVRKGLGDVLVFRWDGSVVELAYREEPSNNALHVKLNKDVEVRDYQGGGRIRDGEIEIIRRILRDMSKALHRRVYFEE